MIHLKANTAITLRIGPFLDEDDGKTAETGLTISQADIRLSKAGGDFAQTNDSGGATHDEGGWYSLQLNATDTNTEGLLILTVHESGALPIWKEFMVLSQAAYDSLYAAKDTGFLDVNIKTVGRADAQETEANNLETACANYSATRGLTGTALPAAAADAAGGLPVSDAGGLDIDTLLAHLDADITSRNATVPDAAGTAASLHATTNALIAALENLSSADAQAAVDAALVARGLDHLVAVPVTGSDIANDSIIAKLVSKSATADWDSYVNTTDALEALRDYISTSTGGITTALTTHNSTMVGHATDIKGAGFVKDTHSLPQCITAAGFATASALATTDGKVDTIDTVVDAIKAITDAIGATAAANLARSCGSAGIVFFTAQTGTLSTTQATTNLSEATDDHYIGRTIIWLTGILTGQATDITDYTGTNGLLTYTELTEAPSNGDTGIIV